MSNEIKSTAPKPFIFVLMPFKPEFNDIYMFGIKGAADEVGAYAENVGEQLYNESILERIYNQINKADVIVADMSGQNPNVFYEVGYAHALNKIVVLLTKNADDIPFDLKHRLHIVYEGEITTLKEKLSKMLAWAISESAKRGRQSLVETYEVNIAGVDIPMATSIDNAPVVETALSPLVGSVFNLQVFIRNSSANLSPMIDYLYLFASSNNKVTTGSIHGGERHTIGLPFYEAFTPYKARPFDAYDDLSEQYRLSVSIPSLPAGAVESFSLIFGYDNRLEMPTEAQLFRLRIHTNNNTFDYPFKLKLVKAPPISS